MDDEAVVEQRGRTAQLIVLVGGILMAVGAFMPWASLGFITISGMQGDGVLVVGIGVVVAVIAAATLGHGPGVGTQIGLVVLSAAALWIYYQDGAGLAATVNDTGPTLLGTAQVGMGIYLGGLGAAAALIGSLFMRRR